MREVQTEPRMEVALKSLDIALHIVRLHIRNIGLGPALNVRFDAKVTEGGRSAEKLLAELTKSNFFSVGLKYLGPGHERVSHYTQMTEDFDGKIASVLSFDISCESASGKKYSETFVVDMSEYKGTYQLGKPHMYAIAQSLEKLQRDIGHIASGFKRIRADVYTSQDREVEDKLRRERMEADRSGSEP